MKLYNLYQNVILEEIIRLTSLNEAVSPNDVDSALDGDNGKFYHVSFVYKDENGTISNRWVQLYQRNISTANNGLIDAYQVSRDGKTSGFNPRTGKQENFSGWKKFRLDRMSDFKVSKVPFYQPQNGFNKTGNNSPTVNSTQKIAPLGTYKYATSTLKQKAAAEKKQQQQPTNVQTAKPQVNQPQTQQPNKDIENNLETNK
jgi:hypothetical protein